MPRPPIDLARKIKDILHHVQPLPDEAKVPILSFRGFPGSTLDMSISQNLFIGPFAEWLVPEGKTEGLPTEDEEGYLFSGKLLCNVGLSLPDVIVRRGRSYHRFCYMPRKGRPGRHGRVMYFAGETADPGIQDLLDTDRQAEIGWFVKTFVKELRVLAGHFGGELAMRWGVVSWYS